MDELDVKILRSLISERAISPSNATTKLSLRAIASRLGADDMTVRYRFNKLKEADYLSIWSLLINPSYLGYRVAEILVDVQPESAKSDMIRKLKLIHEITGLVNFFGKAIGLYLIYNGNESRSRTIELISRITNAESIMQLRMPMPNSLTSNLTENDVGIIRALSKDARKPAVLVAKELRLSTKTVSKRVERLRSELTIMPLPILNIASIRGIIPTYLSYAYTSSELKPMVDREVLSHFDSNYITGNFGDLNIGNIVIGAFTMGEIPKILAWERSQTGIVTARVDIATETFMFPEKLIELLEIGKTNETVQEKTR